MVTAKDKPDPNQRSRSDASPRKLQESGKERPKLPNHPEPTGTPHSLLNRREGTWPGNRLSAGVEPNEGNRRYSRGLNLCILSRLEGRKHVIKPGRPWIRWSAAVGTVATIAAATWLILLQDDDEVRERRYRAETACLLTGEQGITGPAARPIWEGMQRASLKTNAQVTYLAVTGPQTLQNASTYLAGLLQQRCELVIAADEGPVKAVRHSAKDYPQQRFAITAESTDSNVTRIEGTEEDTYILLSDLFEMP
jgi:hypothetical protein